MLLKLFEFCFASNMLICVLLLHLFTFKLLFILSYFILFILCFTLDSIESVSAESSTVLSFRRNTGLSTRSTGEPDAPAGTFDGPTGGMVPEELEIGSLVQLPAPQDLTATTSSWSSIFLSWSAPASESDTSSVVGYIVFWREAGSNR